LDDIDPNALLVWSFQSAAGGVQSRHKLHFVRHHIFGSRATAMHRDDQSEDNEGDRNPK
jgi:hypothetical protein